MVTSLDSHMNTCPFKVGDKVRLKDGGKTIYCVAEVRYRTMEVARNTYCKLCYLRVVGMDNSSKAYSRSTQFCLVWSGDEANRQE